MVALYFINSICAVWPSCEPFVTALLSPLDGPSPSHLGPGSTARIPSGLLLSPKPAKTNKHKTGNLHSVNQSRVPRVQAKFRVHGVHGSLGVVAVKSLGGGVCLCVYGREGSCQLSRDLELASQLATLAQWQSVPGEGAFCCCWSGASKA